MADPNPTGAGRVKKAAALATVVVLALAWAAGQQRANRAVEDQIREMLPGLTALAQLDDGLYDGRRGSEAPGDLTIAIETRPGYGGPLTVALAVNGENRIERAAILRSTDTRTYLERIVARGLLDAFAGQPIAPLPQVDTISGATCSSTAVIQGLTAAAQRIQANETGNATTSHTVGLAPSQWLQLGGIALLFAGALAATRMPRSALQKKSRLLVMVAALVLLGIVWGCQFSLSCMALALSGAWTGGLASWGPLLCMLLALLVFALTKKNLYCTWICPFGTLQEGLGRITGCVPPKRSPWMAWTARALALAALAVALYFRDPSLALYEPFGMAFNLIGSALIFALTLFILLASLAVRRPWCRLLCPVGCLFDYLGFVRRWIGRRPAQKETP